MAVDLFGRGVGDSPVVRPVLFDSPAISPVERPGGDHAGVTGPCPLPLPSDAAAAPCRCRCRESAPSGGFHGKSDARSGVDTPGYPSVAALRLGVVLHPTRALMAGAVPCHCPLIAAAVVCGFLLDSSDAGCRMQDAAKGQVSPHVTSLPVERSNSFPRGSRRLTQIFPLC